MNRVYPTPRLRVFAGITCVAALAVAGCSSNGSGGAAVAPAVSVAPGATSLAANPGGLVLPVDVNPISNQSTDQLFTIDSVLVENNVNVATGKDADDHLEVALVNTGTTQLGGFEIFYTFVDPKAAVIENYYLKLPADFTIPAGGNRIAHFDNSAVPDHFPVSDFSLYETSLNGLDVTVVVSAVGAAPQTTTVQKDPGGDETAD